MGQYQWNWGVILERVPDTDEFYYQWLLSGLGWTVATALAAWVIALIVGSIIGVGRTAPNKWISGICTVYVEIFRNVPLIVQMFLWFFVFPEFLPQAAGDWVKQDIPDHDSAADQRVHEHLQELGGRAGDRADRTDVPDAPDYR